VRALAITRFGGPDVLEWVQVPAPDPGPGEVTIDVAFAGANYAEVLYRRGAVDVPLPFVPGIEVSGHIRALGPDVRGLQVGQPVAALAIVSGGAYAEVVKTDAKLVAPLPEDADAELLALASGVPSNTSSAFIALDQVARLRDGETVLVHAAAGGVGSQLGQVARLLGAAHVVGVVGSPEKRPVAEGFGYDEVVVGSDLAAGAPAGGFDVIVDMVGGSAREDSLATLALGGRMVVMGNASDAEDVRFSANELWFSGKGVLGFNLAAMSASRPDAVHGALERALQTVLERRVKVEISGVFPLSDAASVHRLIESRASTGKLVLDVASGRQVPPAGR
jgi:NADPH2:quinone reductase